MRINQDIAEKPDHLHYPACLGRKTEIEKQSFEILVYTVVAFFMMGILSMVGVKYTIFAVIPELICGDNDVRIAGLQIVEFVLISALSLLGWTKYKIFNAILLLVYILMVVISLFFRDNVADPIALIVGLGGIWKTYSAFGMWRDYDQLRNTEGFPLFSLHLTEYNERMDEKNGGAPQYAQSQSALPSLDASSAAAFVVSQLDSGMPELIMPAISAMKSADSGGNGMRRRYLPESGKESFILESPMKFDI